MVEEVLEKERHRFNFKDLIILLMQGEDHCEHHGDPLHHHIPFEETIEGKKHYQHHFIKKEQTSGNPNFVKAQIIGQVEHTLLEEELADKKQAELEAKAEEIDDSKLGALPLVRFTSQDDVEIVGSKSRQEKKTLYQDTDTKMHIIEEEEKKLSKTVSFSHLKRMEGTNEEGRTKRQAARARP